MNAVAFLFGREERVLAEAEEALRRSGGPPDPRLFADLVGEYRKLYKQSRRLVKMGDRMQGQLNRLNEELARSEDKYRGIFESSVQGIYRSDPDGRFLDVNPAMARMFGYDSSSGMLESGADMSRDLFREPETYAEFVKALLVEGVLRDHPLKLRSLDGRDIWAEANVRAVFDARGRLAEIEGLVADVTEKRNLLEKLENLARRDGLTGLWNRRYFMELGRREIARANRERSPVSMVFFDVDHFKFVNDTHGHEAGDMVLSELADVAGRRLREFDVLGRMGGEEFAVLLPGAGPSGAVRVAEKLRLAIERHEVAMPRTRIRCTASFGVSSGNSGGLSLTGLIRSADQAMYQAKRSGRNRVATASSLESALPADS